MLAPTTATKQDQFVSSITRGKGGIERRNGCVRETKTDHSKQFHLTPARQPHHDPPRATLQLLAATGVTVTAIAKRADHPVDKTIRDGAAGTAAASYVATSDHRKIRHGQERSSHGDSVEKTKASKDRNTINKIDGIEIAYSYLVTHM
jgi:hypothetical protein